MKQQASPHNFIVATPSSSCYFHLSVPEKQLHCSCYLDISKNGKKKGREIKKPLAFWVYLNNIMTWELGVFIVAFKATQHDVALLDRNDQPLRSVF